MRRRSIALVLVAAIAGLVGVWTLRARSRGPDSLEEYRVELEVSPLDAALWFVANNPGYFEAGEEGLRPWLDSLHPRNREFIVAMAQTLNWAWIEHERAKLAGLEGPEEVARRSIVVVRNKTLNQLEIRIEGRHDTDMDFLAYKGDPDFGAGVFGRLVRGASNCDGQNYVAALLIDAALEPLDARISLVDAELITLDVGHEAVRVSGALLDQPIYVDAWANLPPFSLDPARERLAPLLSELGESPPKVVEDLRGRAPQPASSYARAGGRPLRLVPRRHAPARPVQLEIRAPPLDAASLAKIRDPWRLYLYARVLHLWDDPRARELYQLAIDRSCEDQPGAQVYVCEAATLLIERVGD